MHKVTNTSKSSIYPESGECKPGNSCELTTTEYKLLVSNGRVKDYDAPAKKPVSKKKPEAIKGFL